MATDSITSMRAVDLAAAMASRAVSCREVMAASLAQIAKYNPTHNAIINLKDHDVLLKAADAADARVARGGRLPPLFGLPHALKDLTAVADMVCASGSPLLRDFVPPADSIMVSRLRKAGAIFIGKTNVPEFGFGSHTFNKLHGVTRNAYDPTKSAGGSSGGAAVALALNMVPLADGSDMMGSLRNPAGWNGIYALRPTAGLVPIASPDLFGQPLSTEGPMARNMADLALLLGVQAGSDAGTPLSIAGDPARFRRLQPAASKGLRIGWLGDFDGYLAMEPGVLALCETALGTFKALDCHVEPVRPRFDMARLWQAWTRLRGFLTTMTLEVFYQDPAKRALMKPEAIFEVEGGRALSMAALREAILTRTAWFHEMRRLFESFDYLVLPTAQTFPFAAELSWPDKIGARQMDTYHRWMEVVIPASLIGLPTLAVPAGLSPSGLPMGLQIIAPHRQDTKLLELGMAYEAAFGTPLKSPLLR